MRHTMTVQGEHADGTECEHDTRRDGRPLVTGCTGRVHYAGTCSCGWTGTAATRGYVRDMHRQELVTPAGGAR